MPNKPTKKKVKLSTALQATLDSRDPGYESG
jgi:hypothetical protein